MSLRTSFIVTIFILILWFYLTFVNICQYLLEKKIVQIDDTLIVKIWILKFKYSFKDLRFVLSDRQTKSGVIKYSLSIRTAKAYYPVLLFGKVFLFVDMDYKNAKAEMTFFETAFNIQGYELFLFDK